MLVWTLALWVLLVVCAVLNGLLRQSVLVPKLGESLGRALSSTILSMVILLVAYAFLTTTSMEYSSADLWLMGIIWLMLTLAFEFGFGHFVTKKSWNTLLEDYNILKGRIWIIVLVVTLLGPYLIGSLVR